MTGYTYDNNICPNCGYPLSPDAERCPACHCYRPTEIAKDDKVRLVLAREQLSNMNFDEAYTSFKRLFDDRMRVTAVGDKDDTLAFAAFGVFKAQYLVKDEYDKPYSGATSYVYKPTFCDMPRGDMMNNRYRQYALDYATAENREIIERQFNKIFEVREAWEHVRACESEQYDIFISFKNKGSDDKKTAERIFADRLYDYYTSRGYKVFFSPESIVAGAMHEAYIYQALSTAKILLLVGFTLDRLETGWVMNEWTRFIHKLEENGHDGSIITICDRADIEHLPSMLLKNYESIEVSDFDEDFSRDFVMSRSAEQEVMRRIDISLAHHKIARTTPLDLPFDEPIVASKDVPMEQSETEEKEKEKDKDIVYMNTMAMPIGGVGASYTNTDFIDKARAAKAKISQSKPFKWILSTVIILILVAGLVSGIILGTMNNGDQGGEVPHYESGETIFDGGLGGYVVGYTEHFVNNGVATIPAMLGDKNIVKVSDNAFGGCDDIKVLAIDSAVRVLGKGAFIDCVNLASIDTMRGVEVIDEDAFKGCVSLSGVYIGPNMKRVGRAAFSNSGIETVRMERCAATIESEAFAGCEHLTNVIIPADVERLEARVFMSSPNVVVTLDNRAQTASYDPDWDVIDESGTRATKLWLDEGDEVPDIPNMPEDNGGNSEENNGGDTDPNVPDDNGGEHVDPIEPNVPDIDVFGATYEYSIVDNGIVIDGVKDANIVSLDIPSRVDSRCVTAIGDGAFVGTNIVSISIPRTVTSIGKGIVEGVHTLGAMTIDPRNEHYYVENGCIIARDGMRVISAIDGANVPYSAYIVGSGAFKGVKGVDNIYIPETLVSIEAGAFEGMTDLSRIRMSTKGVLNSIGDGAFRGCGALAEVFLASSITTMGTGVFEGASDTLAVRIEAESVPTSWQTDWLGGAYHVTLDSKVGSRPLTPLDKFKYSIFNGELAILSVDPSLTELVIPYEIDGAIVQRISAYKLANNNTLKYIEMPEGTLSVQNSGFKNMTALEELVLPDSLITIGISAFEGCSALKNVTFGRNLKYIRNTAFKGCAIEHLVLPNTLQAVEYASFMDNALGTISMPKGGDKFRAESNCLIDIVNNSILQGSRQAVIPTSVSAIGNASFSNSGIEHLVVPDNIKRIDYEAFSGSRALKSIYISKGVDDIAMGAFSHCGALEEIVVESGNARYMSHDNMLVDKQRCEILRASLGSKDMAGVMCSGVTTQSFSGLPITSITLPKNIIYLSSNTFEDCTELREVHIEGNVQNIFGETFIGCPNIETITLDESNNSKFGILDGCLVDNETSTLVRAVKGTKKIPDGIVNIGNEAFSSIVALTDISIPKSVTSIGHQAFRGSGLKSIVVPSSVRAIEYSAFSDCKMLESAVIDANINKIPGSMFNGCERLERVTIGEHISAIDTLVFYGAKALKQIFIPSRVTEVKMEAFAGIDDLHVYSDATSRPKNWSSDAFDYSAVFHFGVDGVIA